MAFDGAYLRKIKQEIDVLSGGRVDKISQPTKDSIVVALRSGGKNHKLFISAEAAGAKMHFTTSQLENPKTAPMFCMLLRKHLTGAKLLGAEQYGLDRAIAIRVEGTNELGDKVEIRLVCEIMGRRSNIILVNQDGKVIDAIKRVDFVTSEVRQILSGVTYELPPSQDKLDPTATSINDLCIAILHGRDIPLSKAILEQVEGFSPMICREISHFVTGTMDSVISALTTEQKERLEFYLGVIKTALKPDGGQPVIIKNERGTQIDFTFIEPIQYPDNYKIIHCDSYSNVLDTFYSGKDKAESLRQKSADMHKLLSSIYDRVTRKIAVQLQELEDSKDREVKRKYGDIISANMHMISKGDDKLVTQDFYDENCGEIEIALDIMLTPSKNAQKYYTEYKKLCTAEHKLQELIADARQELEYLASVISQIERAETDAELLAIREEIVAQGYSRAQKKTGQKLAKLQPHRYVSSDGFTILSGRNNEQNDRLTLKDSHNYDLWLHTQDVPGSHTVIVANGERVIPSRTIEQACIIAACNSSARNSSKVAVDYTYIKFVKKARGARPGMVIYDNYQTAIVDPDFELANELKQN